LTGVPPPWWSDRIWLLVLSQRWMWLWRRGSGGDAPPPTRAGCGDRRRPFFPTHLLPQAPDLVLEARIRWWFDQIWWQCNGYAWWGHGHGSGTDVAAAGSVDLGNGLGGPLGSPDFFFNSQNYLWRRARLRKDRINRDLWTEADGLPALIKLFCPPQLKLV
jgi:hypothetical protein